MAVSHKAEKEELIAAPARKKRYEAFAMDRAVVLTPLKQQTLSLLLDYRFLIVPQLMRLLRVSDQSARRCLRDLCDGGLVNKIAVPRVVVAEDTVKDSTLASGSAPTIHTLTKAGVHALVDSDLAPRDALRRPLTDIGPKNYLFLRHELMIREIRIWLATLEDENVNLRTWRDADECAINLANGLKLRPDGLFVLDIGVREGRAAVLVGFVEADRATERGTEKWAEKVAAYAALFSNCERLRAATGFRNARVLIVTPSPARCDWLYETIEQIGAEMGISPEILERFWIADRTMLRERTLRMALCRVPGLQPVYPFLSD